MLGQYRSALTPSTRSSEPSATMVAMRRSVAGLLLVIAAATLSLAAVSWWLDQTAFNPRASKSIAEAVLDDDDIRRQISSLIAQNAASSVGVEVVELQPYVDNLAQTPAGARVLEQVVADGHAKVIGIRDDPVQIQPEQIVQLVSDERAGALPPVTVPVEEVTILSTIRESNGWVMLVSAGIGALALILGLLAHPARSDALFGLGALLVFLAVMAVLVGYIVPVTVVPALSDATWVGAVPALARSNSTTLFGAAIGVAAAGLILVVWVFVSRRRRSWSTPVDMGRYRDVQSWR